MTQGDAEAVLGVAAVARRLGVATGTLRTWARRYGIGPSEHETGSRRRYTARDLARLDLMKDLMLEGASAAEAATAALQAAPDEGDTVVQPQPAPRARRGRAGGGRVVALRDASPAARGLARAAMSLDSDACTALLVDEVRRHGVVVAWDQLVQPVLTGIGERVRVTGTGIEVERLFSESVELALRTAVRPRPAVAPRRRPALLAALEPETHRLPLVALAAALRERGVAHRLLGPGLPARAFAAAVTRTGPSAVFLWSQGAADPPGPDVVGAVRPRPAVVLGGPGYQHDSWRPGVRWVDTLGTAVETLSELASPRGRRPGAAQR